MSKRPVKFRYRLLASLLIAFVIVVAWQMAENYFFGTNNFNTLDAIVSGVLSTFIADSVIENKKFADSN